MVSLTHIRGRLLESAGGANDGVRFVVACSGGGVASRVRCSCTSRLSSSFVLRPAQLNQDLFERASVASVLSTEKKYM